MDWTAVLIFGCITGIIIFITSRRHRERMELINKGKLPYVQKVTSPPKTGSASLFLGLLASGMGLAFLLSGLFIQSNDHDLMTAGLLFVFGGAAMLIYWRLTKADREYARRITEEQLAKLLETSQVNGEKEKDADSFSNS